MRNAIVIPMLLAAVAACSRNPAPSTPVPQTPNEALTQFMAAVKANDLTGMGNLWGSDRGPAATFWDRERLKQHLMTIQKYLNHSGWRVIEGPLTAGPMNPTFKNVPSPDRLRDFRVELQRNNCNHALPITLVRTDSGGWLVYDVHLEAAGNPMARCQPAGTGTRP